MDAGQKQSHDYPLLRRRNSISTPNIKVVPTKLDLPNHNSSTTTSSSSDDLELLSIKPASHSYTSLKDLLPSAAVNSPKPNSAPLAQLGSDISIRNHLVKQAAWAYLQPMSTSPGATGDGFFHHLWPRVSAFFDFIRHGVIRILDWTLRFIRIRSSR
ncbi:hypothetical protein ACS0TY_016390 [Phlomoides rotata]